MIEPEKAKLMQTARAVVRSFGVCKNEYVAIRYSHTNDDGTNWFHVTATQRGPLRKPVVFPEQHLTAFCL